MTLIIKKPVGSRFILSKDYNPPDPYFSNVSLLLHGNGTNGSTTIVDSSPSPKTVTAVGSAQISTAQNKFGGSSILLNGSSYLSVPDSAAFEFGSGNFTAEAFVYPTASPNQPIIMGQWDGVGGGTGLSWVLILSNDSNRYLRFLMSTNGSGVVTDAISSSPLTLNAWNYVALVRNGDVFTAYLNGVSAVTYTISAGAVLYNAPNAITIGAGSANVSRFIGYIDELRITKGIARNVSIVPTAPFPNY